MQYPEPILTTETVGDATRVTARYETPETARMMLSLRTLTAGLSFAGLAAAAIFGINCARLDNATWLIAVTGAFVATVGLSQVVAAFCFRRRYFVRRLTDARLVVEIGRRQLVHDGNVYQRGGVLRFTALPHRSGRHEERDERIKERLISTTYREAFQVWLQDGEAFTLLAAVSDEKGAAGIVRRLQEADEQKGRADEMGQKLLFGNRASPE